ncbi:hypothetical protein Tco_0409373 [Tanacetum coccineum]
MSLTTISLLRHNKLIEVEKMVEGDEENPIEVCQENPGTRLEPGSHKECPVENRNDDDNDDQHLFVDAIWIKLKKDSTSIPDLQQQLYMKMKDDPQSQVVDPDMWKVHKAKYEKSSAPSESCRYNIFHKRNHDDHLDDNAPREGEKGTKKQKTSGKSKSAKDSSSLKRPVKDYQKMSFVQQQ